ncbi:MAG: HAD family hydrolase [Halobacteriaceae archaeon]
MREDAIGDVVFDNSGTLSEVVVESAPVVEDGIVTDRVPDVPATDPVALVSIGLPTFSVFDVPDSIGAVVARKQPELHVALANDGTDTATARAAIEADDTAPARTVCAQVAAIRDRIEEDHPAWTDTPVGVQLVVDLAGQRIERVVGYTTVPLDAGATVVEAVRTAGFDPHIVSGDATHILRAVAAAVTIPLDHVHPYQSPQDKADTIRYLQDRTPTPVVMVGDYVNDVPAFRVAHHAIYVRDPDRYYPELAAAADLVIDDLADVVDAIDTLLEL